MTRIANLPWYDLPEIAASTDAFWRAVAERLRAAGVDGVPHELERDGDHEEQWRHPRLLLSQACGYDVLYDSRAHLRAVARPQFSVAGCADGGYRSAVVVRADGPFRALEDLRGGVCAVNDRTSHSGTNALRALIAPLARGGRFFREVVESGAHTASMELLRAGLADVACVDVVVLALCRRVRPKETAELREIARTPPAPAPPWVTSHATEPRVVAALRDALSGALGDPSLRGLREELLIAGWHPCEPSTYGALEGFEAPALAHGYFELPAPLTSPLSGNGRAGGAGRGGSSARAGRSPG
jgi:ABC-type phosphate/phosphonate transport system substrate-binding protein